MSALSLERVSYTYPDGTNALEDITLEAKTGQRLAVIGPNGGGKTTLLKIMAGLLSPSGGGMTVLGRRPGARGENIIGRVGMVFQDPDDQIFMPSVREDAAFGPRNLGLEAAVIEERVNTALATMGLEGYENRVPHHLSYGERKRLALAGILAMEPEVLLLDEPTANLDPRGRRALLEHLDGLERTIVMATHDIEAAVRLADAAVVLDRTVLGSGPVREIMTNAPLLESAGLEPPLAVRIFTELERRGRYSGRIPLTVEEV